MKIVPSILAMMIASTSAFTQAAQHDWYLGIGAGGAYAHDMGKITPKPYDTDKEALALNLFGGYNFNSNFAAELGHLYIGKAGADGVDFSAHGATLSGIASYPVSSLVTLFAEGGGYASHVKGNEQSKNGVSPLAGAGINVKLSDLVDIQARYRYLWNVGDEAKTWQTNMSVATLSLVLHPNRTSYVAPAPLATPIAPAPEPEIVEKAFELSSDVLFAFGKETLKPEGVAALTQLFEQIVEFQPKDGSAVVVGHTDRIGSDAFNQRLSEARARTVADFLVSKGMATSKVAVEGRGKTAPVTGTQCDGIRARAELINCLAPDRRVDVRVTGLREVVIN